VEVLFLRKEEVLDLQAQGIDTFGGLPGLRDEGALDSALSQSDVVDIAPLHQPRFLHALLQRELASLVVLKHF